MLLPASHTSPNSGNSNILELLFKFLDNDRNSLPLDSILQMLGGTGLNLYLFQNSNYVVQSGVVENQQGPVKLSSVRILIQSSDRHTT